MRAHPNDLILTWLFMGNLKRPYFQTWLHSQVLRVKTSAYLLGGQFTTASKVARDQESVVFWKPSEECAPDREDG